MQLSDGFLAEPAEEESAATAYISLRPLTILNDTHAVFRIPQGLASGIYAATLKQGNEMSSERQYVLVM